MSLPRELLPPRTCRRRQGGEGPQGGFGAAHSTGAPTTDPPPSPLPAGSSHQAELDRFLLPPLCPPRAWGGEARGVFLPYPHPSHCAHTRPSGRAPTTHSGPKMLLGHAVATPSWSCGHERDPLPEAGIRPTGQAPPLLCVCGGAVGSTRPANSLFTMPGTSSSRDMTLCPLVCGQACWRPGPSAAPDYSFPLPRHGPSPMGQPQAVSEEVSWCLTRTQQDCVPGCV